MSQYIVEEAGFFLNSLICGILLMLSYDIIRIIRRVIRHSNVFIAFEDFLYWIGAALFVFIMFFKENDGIIRVFSLATMLIGLLLYLRFISKYFVEYTSKLIKYLINSIKKIIKFIFNPIYKLIRVLFKRKKSE